MLRSFATTTILLAITVQTQLLLAAGDEFAPFDRWMTSFLQDHKVPGGSLAIVKNGKVVYARGFGLADKEKGTPVQPESLFRIASISKPITAVAILKLVEEGKLKTSDKILDILKYEPHFEGDAKFDERWKDVTVAQCLAHTGGWDRGVSYDPMFVAPRMAKSMKIDLPILPEHIIRYQLGQKLDFTPGERYAYSNFGYSLLGRVIEKLSGKTYEEYVKDEVLKPLGITAMRMGKSLESELAEGEVHYYDVNEKKETAVTGPGAGKDRVPLSYGVWRQETLDSHGGWIASSIDLARFAAAFDLGVKANESPTRGGLLKAETVLDMFSSHAVMNKPGPDGKGGQGYGYGWMLKADSSGRMSSRHGGALACTASTLIHFPDNINVAVLFNLGQSPDGKFLGREIDGPLMDLVEGLRKSEAP
jgi:N-acyl-D-amino-acid deacylase